MDNMMNAAEIADIIQKSDDIVIAAHIGPDGDAIGSVSALLLALKKMNKNVHGVIEVLPRKFAGVSWSEQIEFEIADSESIKTFIALDCADKARLGKFEKFFDAAEVRVNIDHHSSNNNYGMYNYVDARAAATAELIYNILSIEPFEIDNNIASSLYAGILYDTGGFRHASTTSHTYFAAGELLKYGIDFNGIYRKIFHTMKYEEAQILSTALRKMQREFEGMFIWTSIMTEELLEAQAKPSDLDAVVDYCKRVEGSEIAAFFYQKAENEFKISLRSEPQYDISDIALKFGGGGHKNAAGALFHGTIEECINIVINEVEKLLAVR